MIHDDYSFAMILEIMRTLFIYLMCCFLIVCFRVKQANLIRHISSFMYYSSNVILAVTNWSLRKEPQNAKTDLQLGVATSINV